MWLQRALFHSCLWPSNIPVCVCVCVCACACVCAHTHAYHIFFIHSSVGRHLGCFHVLAIVNSAVVKIGVLCVSFQIRVFIFSKYMSGSEIAALYGNSVFSFLRSLHAVLHSGCTSLLPINSTEVFSLQRKTNITCYPLFVVPKKNDTYELIYKTETDSQI